MEMNESAMDLRKYPIIDPFHTFDVAKVSVPSPFSEHILNGDGSQSQEVVPTPTDSIKADKSNVKMSSDCNTDKELSEEDLRKLKRAQNRAAQRAFRERKENKLKELEEELRQREIHCKHLNEELEQLSRVNLKINAENKTLLEEGNVETKGGRFVFPHETDHEQFGSLEEARRHRLNLIQTQRYYYDESGREILTVAATWDYLRQLSEQLEFNVTSVLENLRGKQVCHGLGAAYPRALVDQLVQEQYIKDVCRY